MKPFKATFESIDKYIENQPHDIQEKLEKMRQTIKNAAPNATESICYQIPTFKLNGNLVHFAGYKNHIGFYPGSEGVEKYKHLLKCYKTSKGAIQFPLNEPLPFDIITKIVEYRVAQNIEKATIRNQK